MDNDSSIKVSHLVSKYGGRHEFIQSFFEADANSTYRFEYVPPKKYVYIPLFHRMGNSVNYYFKLTSKYDEEVVFNEVRRTNALKGIMPFPMYSPVVSKVVWEIQNTDSSNSHTFDTIEQGVLIPAKHINKFFAELRSEMLLLANIDLNLKKLGNVTAQASNRKSDFVTLSENKNDMLVDVKENNVSDDRFYNKPNLPSQSSIDAGNTLYHRKKPNKKNMSLFE